MIGQFALVEAFGQGEFVIREQLVDKHGMMHHIVVAAELRILIFDGVETVRTGGNNRTMFRCYRFTAVCMSILAGVPVAAFWSIETIAIKGLDIYLGLH